jgi:hypothetical protein
MRCKVGLFLALMASLPQAASGQPPVDSPVQSVPLREACGSFDLANACDLLSLVSRFMLMSYAADKPGAGVRAFQALGYDATYLAARHGPGVQRPRLFLVSQRASNRVFVVFPGTEDAFDWAQNAKFNRYADQPADGMFYLPPGHAGFRRGMTNVINSGIIDAREFRGGSLDCTQANIHRSGLADHVCRFAVQQSPRERIQLILVGHSRGAGFIQVGATAFHGLTWRGGQIERAANWPYDVAAIFAYAPPYAIYRAPDRPPVDQWAILEQYGLTRNAYMIIQDGDMVPTIWSPFNGQELGYNQGRHFGHFIRITRDRRAFVDYLPNWDIALPHNSTLYCTSIQTALGDANPCTIP